MSLSSIVKKAALATGLGIGLFSAAPQQVNFYQQAYAQDSKAEVNVSEKALKSELDSVIQEAVDLHQRSKVKFGDKYKNKDGEHILLCDIEDKLESIYEKIENKTVNKSDMDPSFIADITGKTPLTREGCLARLNAINFVLSLEDYLLGDKVLDNISKNFFGGNYEEAANSIKEDLFNKEDPYKKRDIIYDITDIRQEIANLGDTNSLIRGLKLSKGFILTELGKYAEANEVYKSINIQKIIVGSFFNSRVNQIYNQGQGLSFKDRNIDYSLFLFGRAKAKEGLGDFEGALFDFLVAEGECVDPLIRVERGKLLTKLSRYQEALDECNSAIISGSKYNYIPKEALTLEAKINEELGYNLAARIFFRKALGINKNNIDSLEINEGNIEQIIGLSRVTNATLYYGDKENAQEIRVLLSKAIDKFKNNPELYFLKGQVELKRKDYSSAKENFAKARSLVRANGNINAVNLEDAVTTGFNELYYALIDKEKGSVVLYGRVNREFGQESIPYYDLLDTALSTSDISFSLEPTQPHKDFGKIFAKIDKNQEIIDKNKLNNQDLSTFIQLILSDPIDEYGGIHRTRHKLMANDLVITQGVLDLADFCNVRGDLELIIQGKGTNEVQKRILGKIGPTLRDSSTLQKYALFSPFVLNNEQGITNFLSYVVATERKKGINTFVSKFISDELTPKSRLKFTNVPKESQLARILFEADYDLKAISEIDSEQITSKVLGHKNQFEFFVLNGEDYKDADNYRMWITPEKTLVSISEEGSVVSFNFTEMKINIRASKDDKPGEYTTKVLEEYEKFLSMNYDDYSRALPTLHKLREATKVVALSKILKDNGITRLPGKVTKIKWTPPETVNGFLVGYTFGDKTQCAISGGIDLSKIDESVEIFQSPQVPRREDFKMVNNDGRPTLVIGKNERPDLIVSGDLSKLSEGQRIDRLLERERNILEALKDDGNREKLEELLEEGKKDANDMRIAAAELLLDTIASAKGARDTGYGLLRQGTPSSLIEGGKTLGAVGQTAHRFIDATDRFRDWDTVYKTFGTILTSDKIVRDIADKNCKEAIDEGLAFIRDQAISTVNNVLSDPEIRREAAGEWSRTIGSALNVYKFTNGLNNVAKKIEDYFEDSINVDEANKNIEINEKLRASISDQHKKHLEEKRELEKRELESR